MNRMAISEGLIARAKRTPVILLFSLFKFFCSHDTQLTLIHFSYQFISFSLGG